MRTIVIGDIHGCLDELVTLTERLAPTAEDDVLSVGDLITKGPDPLGVLDFWIERGWSAVLGNNEQRVLDVIDGGAEKKEDVLVTADTLTLRPDLVTFIRELPILQHRDGRGVVVVHGGLFPTTSLSEPESWRRDDLLRMRFVRKNGSGWKRIDSDDRKSSDSFWADLWPGPQTVVYGHTPERSVRRVPSAFGIDTGCVYGGELTAAILEDGEWTFESVKARRAWAE